MSYTLKHWIVLVRGMVLIGCVHLAAAAAAQDLMGSATVHALQGSAYGSTNSQQFFPLRIGAVIHPGTQVATGQGAALDLFLGKGAGLVRMTQNTRIELRRLTLTRDYDVAGYSVFVHQGILLGMGQTASNNVDCEIAYPTGRVLSRSALFRIDARGYVVVMDGALELKTGEAGTTAHELRAPPPVFFAPGFGIQPAPPQLIQELTHQSEASLDGRPVRRRSFFSWFRWPFSGGKSDSAEPEAPLPAEEETDAGREGAPGTPVPSLEDGPRRRF